METNVVKLPSIVLRASFLELEMNHSRVRLCSLSADATLRNELHAIKLFANTIPKNWKCNGSKNRDRHSNVAISADDLQIVSSFEPSFVFVFDFFGRDFRDNFLAPLNDHYRIQSR